MALISLRMLLESPNPKDPQDAEVAKMLMEDPESFAQKAHDWAVKYAGAPRKEMPFSAYEKQKKAEVPRNDPNRYGTGLCGWAALHVGLTMQPTIQIPRLQQGPHRPIR